MASHRQRPAERIERDLQAIGALAQAVLDGDDLEQLLGRVAHEARELVEAMSAVVVTVSGESGMMTFRAVDGVSIGPLKVGHVMPARDTLTEMALTRGTNIVASGIDDLPLVGQQFARATGAGPLIASPLARIGSARGVLVVARATDAAPFRPGEVTLVSTFAAQAASAIALFDLRATESLLAAEAERQRIAGDLHTGVIGALLEVRFGVQALAVGDDLQRTAAIESAVARLDEAIETVRRYVAELGASPLSSPQRGGAPSRDRAPDRADARGVGGGGRRWERIRTEAETDPTAGRSDDGGIEGTIAVMGDLARAAAADADTNDILQFLVDEARDRGKALFATVGTLTADKSALVVRAHAGEAMPMGAVGDIIPIEDTAVAEAITYGRAVVMGSADASPVPAGLAAAVGPLVAIPLTMRDKRYGALAVGRAIGAPPFIPSTVRLIVAYGAQAAIALEFERVREELRLGSASGERDRIGRELHDRVVQLLYGVAFALQALETTVRDPAVRASLQAVVEALDRAVRDLRRFVLGLGPGPGSEPRADPRLETLAADNARLQTEIERQLREVRASRRRIIAAGDAERKRVERDLHDGAQQRLVSLTLALRLARTQLGNDLDPLARLSLDQATDEAKAALAELRELARGIHPQILTEAGLGPAIDSLAARSPINVVVDVVNQRFPAAIEGAVYFVVSEALANVAKYARASRAHVRGASSGDELVVEIADNGIGGAVSTGGTGLRGLEDRLETVNGSLEVLSPPGRGTRVIARIPVTADGRAFA